jgi:hypothetical protein
MAKVHKKSIEIGKKVLEFGKNSQKFMLVSRLAIGE